MQVYTKESGKTEFRHFLDNQQYQTKGILRYERIFGQGYVSTGGFETTKVTAVEVAMSHFVLLFCCCPDVMFLVQDARLYANKAHTLHPKL